MKKKVTMTLIACLFCGSMALGQENNAYTPTMLDCMPPAPTSLVLQKFTEYPVSPATGTIDVQIPLYTMNVGNFSIPFALKYHSSGVRVQDPVGAVGRNWALFPGLKISRTIMGKPDEKYPVCYKGSTPSITEQMLLSSPHGNNYDCVDHNGNIMLPRVDGQYDVFRIEMEGLNSSFILQHIDGEDIVKQIPETPLKILPHSNGEFIYGFTVTDDEGICYLFGDSRANFPPQSGYMEAQPMTNFTCGWMLREVIFPNGEKVTFTYQDIYEAERLYDWYITILDNGKLYPVPGCYYDMMNGTPVESNSPYWRLLGSSGYQIKYNDSSPYTFPNRSLMPATISNTKGQIRFLYEGQKISKMSVERANGGSIKDIQFTYDDASGALLKSVSISGEGNYQMKYKNEGNITNKGFDWWGFYNGKTTHNWGLPEITLPLRVTNGYTSITRDITLGFDVDRSPDAAYMDTHSLIEIKSPTGGILNIDYEPHQFSLLGQEYSGGGLRVKSTALYDPISGQIRRKTYSYEESNYLGYTSLDAESLLTTNYIGTLDAGTCTVRMQTYSTFSHHFYMRGNSAMVWYSRVTETADDWKKIWKYTFTPDYYDNELYDYSSDISNSNTRYLLSQQNSLLHKPLLTKEEWYGKGEYGYYLVQTIDNVYEKSVYNINGTIAVPFLLPFGGGSIGRFLGNNSSCSATFVDIYGSPVKCFPYYITAGYERLARTERTTYHDNEAIVETTIFEYDMERPYNVISQTTAKSDGTQETDRYYYSNHVIPDGEVLTADQQEAIGSLTANNRLTTVVQQDKLKGTTSLYSVLNGFDSGSLLKQQYYRKGSGTMGSRMEYRVYDAYRNPIHAVKDGTEHTVYIWGYKGERLVAEIKGADYNTVKNALGCTPESLSSATSPNMTLIDGLRSKLLDATVTTYTHDPLVGPLTKRDANSNVTTYQYDSYGRLDQVKDHSGRQKEKYQYNFRP